MKGTFAAVVGALVVTCSVAAAGPGGPAAAPQLDSIMKRMQQARDLIVTEEDEIAIGAAVSQRVRTRYGVVQDAAVHRYVALVGTVLAQAGTRPGLPWTFIVLDTDGVNAFAAPGGYIHVTRGALGLVGNEAELAGVLAHEIIHVNEKHSAKAIQKGKLIQLGAQETIKDPKVFAAVVDTTTELVIAGFGRAEEMDSDARGIRLANQVGYAPAGLGAFLKRLSERNKSVNERQGLFASHPEMQDRLARLSKQIAVEKLASTATLADRYRKFISYTAKSQAEIAVVEGGASGLAGATDKPATKDAEKKDEQPKKKGFGLSNLLKPSGSEKKSAEVTGSGASRGVDTERNAKGGPVPALVAVSIKPADVAAFKKEGNLK
jgi:beta-barrel assembly-enhancing protease